MSIFRRKDETGQPEDRAGDGAGVARFRPGHAALPPGRGDAAGAPHPARPRRSPTRAAAARRRRGARAARAGRRPAAAGAAARGPARTEAAERRTLVVGKGISLQGTVTEAEKLVIEGTMESQLLQAQELVISHSGVFKGEVQVEDAEIAGVFDGTLTVNGSLTIRATGRVIGVARSRRLSVEDGGQLSGKMEMITESLRRHAPRRALAPVPAPPQHRARRRLTHPARARPMAGLRPRPCCCRCSADWACAADHRRGAAALMQQALVLDPGAAWRWPAARRRARRARRAPQAARRHGAARRRSAGHAAGARIPPPSRPAPRQRGSAPPAAAAALMGVTADQMRRMLGEPAIAPRRGRRRDLACTRRPPAGSMSSSIRRAARWWWPMPRRARWRGAEGVTEAACLSAVAAAPAARSLGGAGAARVMVMRRA